MKEFKSLSGIIITLLFAGSLDAGSDFMVSNRFSLGNAEPVIRSINSGLNRGTLHISVLRKHRQILFFTQRPGNNITAEIYSMNGQKVFAPVQMNQGLWCWTPDRQNGKRYGAGYYLAVFQCGKTRSTIPIIVEP